MRVSIREADVLTACLQYLALRGIFCWRQNQGAIPLKDGGYRRFVGLKGIADILGILPQTVAVVGEGGPITFGNFLAVECKRQGQKPRPEQAEFLVKVKELGGVALCVHSVRELEEGLMPYLGSFP